MLDNFKSIIGYDGMVKRMTSLIGCSLHIIIKVSIIGHLLSQLGLQQVPIAVKVNLLLNLH